LARIGVIGGADMTPECAFTKLAFVLGHDDWDTNKRRQVSGLFTFVVVHIDCVQMMCKNMRGEMTLPLIAKTPSAEAAAGVDLLNGLAKYLSVRILRVTIWIFNIYGLITTAAKFIAFNARSGLSMTPP
jgi:hypothetical protein